MTTIAARNTNQVTKSAFYQLQKVKLRILRITSIWQEKQKTTLITSSTKFTDDSNGSSNGFFTRSSNVSRYTLNSVCVCVWGGGGGEGYSLSALFDLLICGEKTTYNGSVIHMVFFNRITFVARPL